MTFSTKVSFFFHIPPLHIDALSEINTFKYTFKLYLSFEPDELNNFAILHSAYRDWMAAYFLDSNKTEDSVSGRDQLVHVVTILNAWQRTLTKNNLCKAYPRNFSSLFL